MHVDVARGFHTINKGLEFYFESKKCLTESSFKMQKWNSNNRELMDTICVGENEIVMSRVKIASGLNRY